MTENFDDLIQSVSDEQVAQTQEQEQQLPPEEYAAKKKAERESLTAMADNTAMEVAGSSSKFQSYLNTLSRFERYSPQNVLLIHAQAPSATRLGDYKYWGNAGTPVKAGEKATAAIFEPGKEYKRDDGSVGTSFNVKKVFDISQTEAKPEPAQQPDIRPLLSSLMRSSPVPVKLVDQLSAGQGTIGAQYRSEVGFVEMTKGMDGADIFRCLSGEIARAQLDKKGVKVQDANFTAYAASYAISHKNGIEVKDYEFSDAPGYFKGMEKDDVKKELAAVRDTVNDMAGKMARSMEHQKDSKSQEVR